MTDLIVVGAGIAGLTVAHDAARAGRRVTLLEGAERTGGLLQAADLGGTRIDIGAESFATRTDGVARLIVDAALPLQVVSPVAGGAHLRTPTGRAPLPQRSVVGIPADPLADDVVRLIGADAADRVVAERGLAPLTADDEPSLAQLVAARCGDTLVEVLVDPLCRSIYSRPASDVRLSRIHPTLWREAVARGSLLAGVAACAADLPAGSAVGGIVGGMWRLAAELERAAVARGVRVQTATPVRAVTGGRRVRVDTDAGAWDADDVVIATGAAAARALLGDTADAAPAPERAVRVIAALVAHAGLDSHPVGSGVIVAPRVASAAKALTHANAKWPWLDDVLPAGRHIVRLSARDAGASGLDTPADIAREIALLTGVELSEGDILATSTAVYPDGASSVVAGDERRAALAAAGIHLAGAGAAGTGLASVIPHARALAAALSLPSSSRSTLA